MILLDNDSMLRVLLAIDDYNELGYMQTLLKKLGFDVDGVQNHRKFSSMLLTLNPQIVVVTAQGRQIDGFKLAGEIKKREGWPKIVFLRGPGQDFSVTQLEASKSDVVLSSPVNPKEFLRTLAKLGGMDPEQTLEKFTKIKSQLGNYAAAEDEVEVKTTEDINVAWPGASVSDSASAVRAKKYTDLLSEFGPLEKKSLDREKVRQFNKEIRSQENLDEIKDLEDERQGFVKALFVSGSKKKS